MFYITVKDRYMRKLGIISNDIPQALHFRDDKQHEFLAEGAETFELTIKKYMNGLLKDDTNILTYGNILSFYDENNNPHVFMIQHPIETRRNIKLQCTSLNLELINEQVDKYTSTARLTFFQYLNNMSILINSSMQLNINEVSNKTLALTFDTQETKLARLLKLVSAFDAECEMLPVLTSEGTMDHLELNVYIANDGGTHSGVGRYRNDVLITIGKDVQDITRDIDGTNMFNATVVTGQNGEHFKNANVSILNDNGEEEFYIRPGSSTAYAPLSKMKYPATTDLNNTDGWTSRNFQIQSTDPSDLVDYAIKMLKSYAYPVVTYSLTTSTGLNWDRYNLSIGDTIKISDMKFDDQGLVLSARVTEKVTSRANPNLNSVVFSNFVRRKVQISSELQNLIKQQLPYNINILTDNGIVLKKAGDSTTLSVYMSKGQDLDTQIIPDKFIWSINGNAVPAGGTLLVRYDDLKKDTNIITVQTIINDVIVGSAQITITKVTDGKDGRSIIGTPKYKYMVTQSQVVPSDEWGSTKWSDTIPTMSSTNKYLWQISQTLYTAEPFSSYATILNSVYGDNGNDGIAGKDGVGLKKTDITYAISTDGTISPTGGWTAQVPTLVKGQYLWTKTVWTYTDNTNETGYSVTYISKDGNNGTDGIAGKDGVGITSTDIKYVGSTNGTISPTSGWTASIPSVPAGQFLWTKTVWHYSDTTSETGYSVAMMGPKGDKGDQGIQGLQGNDGAQGIPGPKGADGKTQYTHIAYANSANGVTDFSTSDSNRTYIGMYVDFNVNDSITPSNYSWTLVKGADGTQGTPGKPGADGKTPYFHTAWSNSADGTDGFTTVYPNLNLLDGTKDFSGTWNNSTLWTDDGTYNGLKVRKRTAAQRGTYKIWTVPTDGTYTFSCYIKSSGPNAKVHGAFQVNGIREVDRTFGDNFDWKRDSLTRTLKAGDSIVYSYEMAGSAVDSTIWVAGYKIESDSIATPHMPSISEATTADWPRYIGQYTDFTQADSTNPSDYTWSLIRGNDGKDGVNGKDGIAGKDGVGIKATVITYTISTSGTTAPTTGWTSSVPSLVKGQYLWTKTVWTYTDNSSETGYSVTYISKDGNNGNDGIAGKDGNGIKTTTITYVGSTSGTTVPTSGWTSTIPTVAAGSYLWTKTVWTYTDNTSETGYSVAKMGNTGPTGPAGAPGANGAPGKIVSNSEPISLFTGLTWKYSGTTDLTARDGTKILAGTEYYWNGSKWTLYEVNAHNINGDNLSVTNGTFTDGVIQTSWKNGAVAGSTNIQNDHLIITRTDSSVNTTNSIGLDSTQGLIMVYTENSTGRTISVGTNFQGMFLTDSTGISASISPAGVKLASDVDWTAIGNIGGRRAEWKRENNRVTMNIHGGNGDNFPTITSSGTLLGILPTNARPSSDISMPATAQGASATAQISINSTGEVRCYRWGGNSVYFGAYISYYVD